MQSLFFGVVSVENTLLIWAVTDAKLGFGRCIGRKASKTVANYRYKAFFHCCIGKNPSQTVASYRYKANFTSLHR